MFDVSAMPCRAVDLTDKEWHLSYKTRKPYCC